LTRSSDRSDSADRAEHIVFDEDMDEAPIALNVSKSGFVSVTSDSDVTGLVYIAAGVAFPIRCKRVNSIGTTALNVVGMW